MNTLEVTTPGNVPDNHRSLITGKLKKMRRQFGRHSSITKGIGRFYGSTVQL
jgi:hypothetical protein